LPDNIVRAICEGSDGRLWVTTNNGCAAITVEKVGGKYAFYASRYLHCDGLVSSIFSRHSLCRLRRSGERMLFGTDDGYSVVEPSRRHPSKSHAPQITGIMLSGVRVDGDSLFEGRRVIGDNEATLRIHVEPPFYQTWYAYLFYILSLCIVAWLFWRYKLQIAEVAYKVGFNSPKVYAKNFKAEYDLTPSEYKKKKRTS